LARLESELSELLETKVTVELGRRRGKLTVAFASFDDLQRVLGVLAPQVLTEHSLGAESGGHDHQPLQSDHGGHEGHDHDGEHEGHDHNGGQADQHHE
jgi:hypothetical protein